MERYSDSDITLRPVTISDADHFMQWYFDEKVSKFCSWDVFASREAAVEYFVRNEISHPWNRAICVSGRVVGCVSVSPFQGSNKCRAEIGYVVSVNQWLYSHNYCLDLMQRLTIMIDVACALEYLHHGYSTLIVHCDLKPSNVLLDEEMVAHVSDFGIAKLMGEGESTVHTNTLATMGYIAPA